MLTNHTIMIISMMAALGAALVMMEYLKGASRAESQEPGVEGGVEYSDVQGIFDANVSRLEREIHALSRRGNLNLTIGVITTGFAVGLLAYMVMNEDAPTGDTADVLSHYIPRISTVSFIEVFSYFFLRLYRASLAEIKYYQNELTVLAGQRVALEYALDIDSAALGRVLDRIVSRDPNANPGNLTPLASLGCCRTAPALSNVERVTSGSLSQSSDDPRLKLALELADRIATVAGVKAKSAV